MSETKEVFLVIMLTALVPIIGILVFQISYFIENWKKYYTEEYKKFIQSRLCPSCLSAIDKANIQFVNIGGESVEQLSFFDTTRRQSKIFLSCYNCGYKLSIYKKREKIETSSSEGISNQQISVEVGLYTQEKRVKMATERVTVPQGVVISVKRSRTIEHTININWRRLRSISGEIGIKQLISLAIQSEIEKSQGRIYHKSETIEYEVKLNGEKGTIYELTWFDVWISGNSEITHGGTSVLCPFKFRERSELIVSSRD